MLTSELCDRFAAHYTALCGVAEAVMPASNPAYEPEDLVHDTFLSMCARNTRWGWNSGHHFRCQVATLLRHQVIDTWRRGRAAKRGGGAGHEEFENRYLQPVSTSMRPDDLIPVMDIEASISRLEPRLRGLLESAVEGIPQREIAESRGMSLRSVQRGLAEARAGIRGAIS